MGVEYAVAWVLCIWLHGMPDWEQSDAWGFSPRLNGTLRQWVGDRVVGEMSMRAI
ncbi:MAG: hypothetical protein HC837_20490 [Chloroflexaceae bacterium]|nr:hypothetical protein [Chloroflexaceae bacterium]